MHWPRIEVVQDDRVIVRDGFRFVFFLNESHSSLRPAIDKVLKLYFSTVNHDREWLYVDDEGFTQELTRGTIPDLLEQRFTGEYASTGSIKILNSDVGIPDFEFYYYGKELPDPANPGLRNYAYGFFSSNFVHDLGAEKTISTINQIAEILPLCSGYASPALLYSQEPKEAVKRALRYPGFDVLDPSAARVDIDSKIAGVYWLSFLGSQLTDSLGGIEVLTRHLPNEVSVLPVGKCVAILLGTEPVVGDTNRGRSDLGLYRALAHLLEPVLHLPEITYVTDEDYMPDRDIMLRWHRRFLD
jgi:Protein of unknown function (DUF3396)